MSAAKKGVYQIPPKEGFVLTHFLTVADVLNNPQIFIIVFLEGKSFVKANQRLSRLQTAGSF